MRRALTVITALTVIVLGMASSAGADSATRPFKGSMTGEGTWVLDPGCVAVNPLGLRTDSRAAGTASHLGALSMTSRHCTPIGAEISGGEMELIGANGDQVHIEYSGTGPTVDELVAGEYFTIDIEFAVVGGTGRFEEATGGGRMIARALYEGSEVIVVPATWSWTGTISY